MVSGLSSVVDYVYDDANRLTSVNGVTYTWDNNGNLLNDGVNAYTYNTANQLKTLTGPSVNASYAYNGMGDRLQEVHNGGTTNFMMDYNMGLTQVLNDGTNNYIYGNGRIAQVNTSTDYFLGDALGSVRQLTNNSGAITYASAYDPYGVATQAYGASQTAYGFTGEYTSNDLVYLRARYYVPYLNQFIQPDTIVPDPYQPMDWNKYLYVRDNPINYTDPSGHNPLTANRCQQQGCKWPKHNKWAEKAQKYGDKSGGYMATYAIASIGVQNPNIQRWYLPKALGGWFWGACENTHLGLAKVSDNEMNTDYGVEINDGGFRGYGLGMSGQDQTDPKVAVQAMIKRIQIVDNTCDDKCTSTDHFLVAALAQNGGDFTITNLNELMHGDAFKPRPTNTTHSLNWELFLDNASKKEFYQDKLIGPFAANVLYLKGKGWDVPDDIDWQYVCDLYTRP